MRVLIQRVKEASVTIDRKKHASIGEGMLILIGVHREDTEEQADWLAKKCFELRIFDDKSGKMNLSLQDINGEVLVISQFTLYGSCHSGRRPEFTRSAKGLKAKALYHAFIEKLKSYTPKIKTGIFGADMKVELINNGPVTFLIEK